MSATPRFPDAVIRLTGSDGNAFAVMGKAQRALRQAGATDQDLLDYVAEATSGDYDHLLTTTMRWVEVI